MNVVVYSPDGPEDIERLRARVAAVHAQAVARYLQKLSCPEEQKRQLIKKIEESIGK